MLACSLDMVVSRLFDAAGCGDIRLDMLNFVRKKTPDIGGENIVLAVHIRRDGEEPAGAGNGGVGNGTHTCAGAAKASGGAEERTERDAAGAAAGAAAAGTASAAPVRGKILEA